MPKKKSVISKSAKAVMTGVIVGSLGVGGAVAGVGSINQHSISPTIENAYGDETYVSVIGQFGDDGTKRFSTPIVASKLDENTFNNFGFVDGSNKTATVYGTIFAKPNSKVTVWFRAFENVITGKQAIKKVVFDVDDSGVLNINYTWSFDKDKDKDVMYKNMVLVPGKTGFHDQKNAYATPPAGIMYVSGKLAKLNDFEKNLIKNSKIQRVVHYAKNLNEYEKRGLEYNIDCTNVSQQEIKKENFPHFSKALKTFSEQHPSVFHFPKNELGECFKDSISNDVTPNNKHFYTYPKNRNDLKSAIEKEYGFNYLPIFVKGANGKEYIYDYLPVSSAIPVNDSAETLSGTGVDAQLCLTVSSAMSDYKKKHPEINFDNSEGFIDFRFNGKLEVHAKYDEQYLMNHEEALKAHLETLSKRYHIMKKINSTFRTDFPEYAYLNDVFPEYGVVDLEKYKHYYGNSDMFNILENVDFNKYYETMTNISPVDNMPTDTLVDKVIKSYTTADLSDETKKILHSVHSNNNPVNPIFKDAVDRIDWYKYTWGHKFSQIEIEQFSDTLEKSNIDGQIFGFDSSNSVLLNFIPANRNNIVVVKQGILNSNEIYSLNKRLGKIKIPVTSHEGQFKYGFVEIDPVIECDGLYDIHTAIYNTVNMAMKNWLQNNQPELVENKILSLNLVNNYNNTVDLTREIDKDNFFSLLRLNEYKFDGELEVQGAKITGQDYVKYNYVPKMVDLVQRELNLVSLGNKLEIDIKDMYQDFKSVNDIGIRMDFIKLCRAEFEKDPYKQGTLYSEENVLGYTDDVMRIGKEKIQAELNLVKSMEKKIESGIKTKSAQYGFNKQLEKDLMFLLQSISENENMSLDIAKVKAAVQKVRSYKNAEDKPVNFEDENLKQYVLDVMKDQKLIPENAVSVTEKQALLLNRLELIGHPYEYKNIRSLKGLGCFENLKTLTLNKLHLPESSTDHNIISHHLKRLERLVIRDSDVDTRKLVFATCDLLNLNYLALVNNSLTKNVQDGANSSIDLSMIRMLKTLKIVGMPFHPITCHVNTPINLESFSLQFGNFDISGSNMLKEVSFNKCVNNVISGSDTPLTKFLKSCPNLEKITINNVKNITNTVSSWGGNLKKLKWLSLNSTDLNDMNVFPESLEHFEGSHCNLSSVIPFKDLKNLNFLNIGYNHITDLVPVKHVKYVKANNQKISLQPKSAKIRLFEQVPALGTPTLTTPDNNIVDGVLAYNAATMNTPYTVKLSDHSQDYNQEYSATVTVDFSKADKTPVVQFKDENLKQALLQIMKDNQLIEQDATDITEEEAAKLKLYKPITIHNNVKDLTGLEKFTNIFELDISGNPITNLEPLRGIKHLLHLNISNTKVNDLTPLSDLQGLSDLKADDMHLKSLSPLLTHKNSINELQLNNTKIDDGYGNISQFSELMGLGLESNNISDMSFLSGLLKLNTLSLVGNAVLDVEPLKSLTALNKLYLYNQKVSINSNTQTVNSLFKYKDECKVSMIDISTSQFEHKYYGHFDGSNFVLDVIPQVHFDKWVVKVDIANKPNITGINTMGGIDKFAKDSLTDKYYSMALTIDFTEYINSLIKRVQDAQGDNTAKQKIIDKINQGDVSIEEIENDMKQLHQATPVQFKDQVLKNEIINALLAKGAKLNSGEVTDVDCENLTELSIGFPETGIGGKIQKITNLSDLQYLKNLKKVAIADGHAISDLSPLAQCPQLETINIAGVNNPDVTPLKALTKLKSVSLPDQDYRLTSSKDTVPLNFLHHLSDITLVSNDGNPVYGSIQGNDFILGTFPANNVARINFKCEKSSIDGVPIGTYTGTISIDYSDYRKKIEEMIKLLDEKKAKDIQGKINSGHMSMVELHKDLESVENAPVFTEKQLYKILARTLGKEEGYIVKKEDLDKIQSIKLTKEEFETMEFLKNDFHQLKNLKSIDASNLGAETFNKIELKLGTKLVKDKIKPAPLEKFSADNNHIFSIDKLSNSVITFHGQTFTNTATNRTVNISQLKYNAEYRPGDLGKTTKYTGLISSSLGEALSQGQEKYGYKFIEKNFTGNVRLDKIPTKPQIEVSVSNPRYNFDGVYTVDFAPYIQSLKDKVADSTAEKEEKDLVLKMINTAGTSIDDIEMAILRLGKTAPSDTQTEDISGELQKLLDSYNSVKATDNYKNADDNLKQTYDTAITEGQKVYDKLSSTPEQVKQAQQTIQSALEALNGDKKAQAIKEQLNTTTRQVSSLQEQLEKAKQQGTADKSKIEQLGGQISTLNSQLEQLKADNTKSIGEKQQEIAKLNGQIADLNKQVAQLTQDKQSLQSQLDTATSKVQNLTGELENAKRQGVADKATIERITGELQQAKQQLEQLKQDKTKSDEEKQKEINQLNTKITELGKQITQLTQEKSSLTEQLQTAQQSISTLQDKLQKATEQGTADKSKIEQLNGQISTLNSQLEKIKSDKTLSEQQKQAEIDKLNGQITELGKQISQLTAEKQSLQQQLDKATGSVQNLTGELENAKRQGVADKATIERINGELQQTKQQLEQLKQDKTKSDEQKQKEIEQLNAKIGELGQQITQLNKDKENLTQQLQTAQQSLSDTQQKLKKAEEQGTADSQTISVLNEKIRILNSQLEQLKQDNTKSIGEKQKEIEKLNGQIDDLNKQVSQLTQDKKTLSEQLQQTQSNLADIQKKLQTATEQGVADKATIEQLNGQISTLNSQLEKLKSDKTLSEQEKQAEIDKLNGQITDLGKQVEQLTKDKQNLQSQIEQLNKKVDELNTKANTCSISDGEKAKELEKVKGELQQTKQQLEQLKQDKTKSDEEKQAEINKLNGQITELGKQVEQLTEAKNSLQQQLDNANGKIQTLTGELDKAKQQGTADKATIERITGELQQTKQQLEQLKQDKTKSDEQKQKEIEQLNGKIAELGNQIKQLNSDKESLTQQLQTAQQSLSETQQKLKKAEEQGTLDSQTISGLNEQIKTLNGQIEKLKSDKTLSEQEKQAEIDKLNGQATNLGKQVEELTKEKNSLQQQLDTATGNIQKLTGELDKAKQQGAVDKAKIEELNGKVNTLNSQLEQLKQDKTKSDEEKQAEINKLNGQIEDLNKQVTQLTKDKESLQQQLNKVTENLSNVTAQLEQAKKDKQQADENNQQAIATLNGQIAQLNKDKQDLRGQVNDKAQQISSLNNQLEQVKQDKTKNEQEKQAEIEKLNGQIAQLTKDKQELQGKLDTADGKIQTLTGELDKAKQQGVTDKATIERITGELQQTKQQLEQLKQDKTKSDEEKQKEIEQLNTKITDLGKQVAQLTKDKESLAQQLQQTQQSLSDVQQKLKKAEEQGVADNSTISELNEKIKTLNGQLEQLKQDKTKSDDEKQKEIDKLNGQVEQLNNQVTQLTKDKENLTHQLQETQGKLNNITNELSQVKKEKQDKINELNGQISQLQTDKQKLQESVVDKTQQISTLNSQLEQLKQDNTKNEQEKQKEVDKLNGQIAQLTKEKQELQSKLDTADSNVQKLTGELDKAKQQNTADNAKISELNEKVNTLNSQIEQLKQDKTKSVEEKQKEIDKLNGQIEDLNKQVSQLTKDKQSLQSQLEQAQQSLADVQKKLQKAQEQGTLDTNSIATLTQQVKTLNEQLNQLKQDKTKSEQEKQAEIDKLNGQITDLTKQVEQLTQDKKTLSEQLQQTQENLVDVQKKLQTATEQGTADKATIERIAGELQQTKQQLEQLKQDKTKSDEQKQKEIEQLNEKVADLNKQVNQLTKDKQTLQQQLDTATGNVQKLTNELDKAKQQGTADKATIERITGELQQAKNALEQLKQDKTKSDEQKQAEIDKLNGQVTELGKQIAQLTKDKENLTQQLQQTQDNLSKVTEQLEQAKKDKQQADEENQQTIATLNNQITQLNKDKQDLQGQINDKTQQISTLNSQLEQVKQDKTKNEQEKQAEIEKLNGQIAQLTKDKQELQGKLDTADSNVQKLTNELEKAKQQNTADKETIDHITGELQQTKQQLEQLKQDKTKSDEEKQAEINKLNTKIADLGNQITQLTKDKETLQQQLTKAQENVNTLQSELEKAKQQGTVDKAKIEQLTNQVDTLNKQVKQLEDDKVKSEQEKKAELNVLNKQIEKLKKDLNDSIMGISHEPTVKIQPNGDKVINDKITVKPNGEITVDNKTVTPDKKVITPSGTISGDKVETKGGTELEPNKITVHTEKGKVTVTPNTVDMNDGKEPIHIEKDGTTTLPNGMKVDKQGNVTLPDGTKVNTNGDVIESGDTTVNIDNLPNGSFTTPDGTKIEKGWNGGIKITKDNTVVETAPDGSVNIHNNGTKDSVTIASNDDGTTTVTVDDPTGHSKEITIKNGTMTTEGNTVDKDKVVTPEGNTVDKYGAHVGDIQIKPNGDVKVGVVTIDNKGEILHLQSSMVHPLIEDKPVFDLEKYKKEHPEEFAEPDKSMGDIPTDEQGLKDYNKKYKKVIENKIKNIEETQQPEKARELINQLKHDIDGIENDIQSEKEKSIVYDAINKQLDDIKNIIDGGEKKSINDQISDVNNEINKIKETPENKTTIEKIKKDIENIANETPAEQQKKINEINYKLDKIKQQGASYNIKEDTPSGTTHGTTSGSAGHSNSSARETIKSIDKEIDKALENNSIDRAKATAIKTKLAELKNELSAVEASRVISKQEKEEKIKAIEKQLEELKKEANNSIKPVENKAKEEQKNTDNKTDKLGDKKPIEEIEKTDNLHDKRVFDKDKQGKHERLPKTSDTTGILYSLLTGVGVLVGMTMRKVKKAKHAKK